MIKTDWLAAGILLGLVNGHIFEFAHSKGIKGQLHLPIRMRDLRINAANIAKRSVFRIYNKKYKKPFIFLELSS
jgi:hypothetical protein